MAKRNVLELDFGSDGAHVALVPKGANGQEVLIMKSKSEAHDVVNIQKQDVTVEMPFTEFLRTFMYMYSDDAEVLARVLGYEVEDDSFESYQDYIDNRVEMVTLLRANQGFALTEEQSTYVTNLQKTLNGTKVEERDIMNKEIVEEMIQKARTEIVSEYEGKIDAQKVDLDKALSEVAELKKLRDDNAKDEYTTLVKGYSYIEDDKKNAVADFLFKSRDVEGFVEIVESLEKAYKAIEEFATLEKGQTVVQTNEFGITNDYTSKVSELLKSRKN